MGARERTHSRRSASCFDAFVHAFQSLSDFIQLFFISIERCNTTQLATNISPF